VNSADLKQNSPVLDKSEEIQLATSENANISTQIENKRGWTMRAIWWTVRAIWWTLLAIWQTMRAISWTMQAISHVIDAPRRVQGFPHLIQSAETPGRDCCRKSQI
jgi:hypothetical protein